MSNPGIIFFLAGSTIVSFIATRAESILPTANEAAIVVAFAKLKDASENLTVFGITPLEALVFCFGTLIFGIPRIILRSGGPKPITCIPPALIYCSSYGLTTTNPPIIDAATLS